MRDGRRFCPPVFFRREEIDIARSISREISIRDFRPIMFTPLFIYPLLRYSLYTLCSNFEMARAKPLREEETERYYSDPVN